jgi:hypothetical protein
MNIPAWADVQLSQDLPNLRAQGEGQEIEFKQEFPQQVSDLGKEIAAFATSNAGTLFIGVTDGGDLVGLAGCEHVEVRDGFLKRLEGICCGTVKPAVTPRIAWAVEAEKTVLVMTVPKGSEPVYYSQSKPYLRHVTSSRPAEPHEVVELVKNHLASRIEPENSNEKEKSAFYSDLASLVTRALVWAETPSQARSINPWLAEWRAEYSQAANELMQLASEDVATRLGLDQRLRDVADSLVEVSTFQMSFGCGPQLEAVAGRAKASMVALKADSIDRFPLSSGFVGQAKALVNEASRRLLALSARAQQMIGQGRYKELLSEVGSLGSRLVQVSFHELSAWGDKARERLREVGMRMRLLEVARIYMDGGASLERIANEVAECAEQLAELVVCLEDSSYTVQQGIAPDSRSPTAPARK